MALGTHELQLTRQKLDLEFAASKAAWAAKLDELQAIAGLVNGRVEGVPAAPTIATQDIERSFLLVADSGGSHPLDERTSFIRNRVAELCSAEVPSVEAVAGETAAELDHLTTTFAEQNARRNALFRARQEQLSQIASIARRLAALEEDLQKNLDAQKLRNFGSKVSETFAADHCPTCAQPIQDTLLAQQVSAEVMPIEDNIEYIKSQVRIFSRLKAQAEAAIAEVERQFAVATSEVNEVSARLRALRADMVGPSHAPSVATIAERVRLEARLEALEDAQQRFEKQKMALISLATHHAELLAERSALPRDRFTAADLMKLEGLTTLIREQTSSYDFSTFDAAEIDISTENYRPQKEGFEIGFELSASDAIRLKWAYQLALMELARSKATNHPGFVVFDEPRQQETAKVSFRRLLERAATAKAADQQVIFATSEDRDQLDAFLADIDCRLIAFEGHIVRRILDRQS
jgi:hypothetical protein